MSASARSGRACTTPPGRPSTREGPSDRRLRCRHERARGSPPRRRPRGLGRSFALGSPPWFVVEGDEYDSAYFDKEAKFLHYRPAMLLLNAIEFDHADIYRDVEHVKSAFRKLLAILPERAPLVACGDFPHVLDVIAGARARVRRFGLGEANEWRVTDLADDGATRFTVREAGRAVCRLTLQPPGAINACNALGVLLLAREVGVG